MKNQNLILLISIASIALVLFFGCEKEEENKAPTCTITSPTNGAEIEQGETVTISVDAADEDGNIAEVCFYVDGVDVSSSNNFPYNYIWATFDTDIGSHTIKATAKDNAGKSVSDEVVIVLTGLAPVAEFTASQTTISEDGTITFTDQSANAPTRWNWNFSDGNSSSQQNPSHTYITAGTYTVSLEVTNSIGSDTKTKIDYIVVNKQIEYGTVTDYDGNTYNTVTIGTQEWMAENLKVTHYPNGNTIPLVTDNTAWADLEDNDTDDAYCYYDNSNAGALYTYASAIEACPTGWHLPTDEEWKTLEMYLGMSQSEADDTGWRGTDEGEKLKATSGWNGDGNGTDIYGFSALPSGYRDDLYGTFGYAGLDGFWWSSTENNSTSAYNRDMGYNDSGVYRYNYNKSYGFSVRCTRDN